LGFGSLAENFLVFDHRQKSQEFSEIPCGQFRINSSLGFLAKNSNARYAKSLRIRVESGSFFWLKFPKFFAKLSFKFQNPKMGGQKMVAVPI